ncbi:MAG: hypothetical protein BWK76_26855 [Desulfobulbaceae bacterium A2]|nr:MAG: hypothetical protein BWK76_26855 [Desulfobulbaceae bacterium A2]
MTASARVKSLMTEFQALDPEQDCARMREILAEAAGLVDRTVEPKKWAALRSKYAWCSEELDPVAAVQAYREALAVWDRTTDHDSWASCHGALGNLLVHCDPCGPEQMDEAIGHLECALADEPWRASLLALLYRFRVNGDPADNWRKRIQYQEMALAACSRDEAPLAWAQAQNELGEAYGDEPDADFIPALERRIACHLAALAALGERRDEGWNETWIETSLALSECYLFRGPGQVTEDLALAEGHARGALARCDEDGVRSDLRATALLTLGKSLIVSSSHPDAAAFAEALALFDKAAALIDPLAKPALMATVESLRANVCLKRIALGERGLSGRLLAHADAALDLLAAPEHLRDRRSLLQVAGEGLLAEGDFARAVDYLGRAVAAADTALMQADSVAGRMERIWEFRDSSALLGYGLLRLGRTQQALVELDRGKARFWQDEERVWTMAELAALVPAGGALLFPNFAATQGVVVAVTAAGSEPIWLPDFGLARLMELQRGGLDAPELGGWLKAYALRNSEHDTWRQTIDLAGGELWSAIWAPVLARLAELGVEPGAELVWFPQGGSGVFPLHAAWYMVEEERRWLLDDYTLRYAPSVRAVLARSALPPGSSTAPLLVVNPTLDLSNSELECAWVRRQLGQGVRCLRGEEASSTAVLQALACCDVVHFSSHAMFDLNRPLQSFLLMAGGERLTIEALLPVIRRQAFRLVALSACETAMARTTVTPDEFLGFPAALLHAGTRSVLATLWPVDDAASALLVGRFYQEWRGGNMAPALALRQAQNWLRRVRVRELLELLRGFKDEPAPVGPLAARCRTQLRGFGPDHCPYAAPWFWAAFTISGKE